ncbi:MAG: ABC transporter permease [Clostridiales bacterium]|jgi:putative ABC transport system permease protein|nr:ABC transporter permease [Clostridiales bacterium]
MVKNNGKGSYIKYITRGIKNHIGRFLAIIAITALGAAFITGLSTTAPNMRASIDAYLDARTAADIIIKAPYLSADDIAALTDSGYADKITPAICLDADIDGMSARLYYLTLGENIVNKPVLLDGRLPNNHNEIVVETSGTYIKNIAVGTVLTFGVANIAPVSAEYTVVGIVSNAWYFSKEKELTYIGRGYLDTIIYFDISYYESLNFYTDALITVKDNAKLDTFSDRYKEATDEAIQAFEALGENKDWYISDRETNQSFLTFRENANKIEAISVVFPVFFLLVATLVVLTTMTRTVNEERLSIGTLKSLGYSDFKIASKYILYALFSSLIGVAFGVISGFRLLPAVIYNTFSTMFHLPELSYGFYFGTGLISSGVMVISILGATVYSALHTLKETSAALLRPKTPKAGKRILLEKIPFIWKHLKFKYKSTLRNVFRYKKHFFMTIIGIAGCTALVFAGLGLKDSADSITKVQYSEILKYDVCLGVDGSMPIGSLSEYLNNSDGYIETFQKMGYILSDKKDVPATLIVVRNAQAQNLNDFITLRERKSKSPIKLTDGVIISEGISVQLGIKQGDTFVFDGREYTVYKISENYVNNYIYMTENYSGFAFETTHIFVKDSALSGNADQINESLSALNGVSTSELLSETKEVFQRPLLQINFVIIIIIVSAGALAVIVIYNLTNVNIEERKKEIAALKVLGYHDREVAGYVYRETAILTLLGSIAGLGLGVLLLEYVVKLMDGINMMMGRHITPLSFILAFAATFLFTSIVGVFMYGKLKKIDMNASMKDME